MIRYNIIVLRNYICYVLQAYVYSFFKSTNDELYLFVIKEKFALAEIAIRERYLVWSAIQLYNIPL